MGRSLGNKKHFSQETGGGGGGGMGESETSSGSQNFQFSQKKNQNTPKNLNNVRYLIEKLKHLRPHHEDILKLESVKTVISALGESDGEKNCFEKTKINSDSIFETSSSSYLSKQDGSNMKILRRRSGGESGESLDNFQTSKFTRGGPSPKSQKHNNSSNISTDSLISSGVHPAGNGTSTTTLVTTTSRMTTNFATLLHNFGHFYKRVAKKYSFMLRPRKPSKSNFFGVFFSILAFIFYYELHTINGFSRLWLKWENVDLSSVECTIESPNLAMELFRPPVSCAICHDVRSVDKVSDISPTEFERMYAYTGRPVIVTDAMTNWTAPNSFSFEFFKGMYSEGSRSLMHLDEDCLFFPYQTEFGSLAEVFNMTKERSQRSWYIGWSNCDAETSHILRHHYQRPYFLPETAESTHADWIFMGTPGKGAHMHIDHVINPSWQGQVKGFKRWFLQPPPECLYECHSFHVDVHPGDIIVLDTNKWYHQTEILSGENSITIGSEYD